MRHGTPTRATTARRIGVCVAVGALATFLSSVLLTLYSPVGSLDDYERGAVPYPFAVPPEWPPAEERLRYFSPGFEVEAWRATSPDLGGVSAAIYRSGWPLHAMERRQLRETLNSAQANWNVRGAAGLRGGLPIPPPLRRLLPGATRHFRHHIPITPLPVGFVINTALFAGVVYGVWRLRPTVVRSLRARRGVCLVCGYDVDGLAVCPECGETLIPEASG